MRNDILIIGGGIAGINCALSAAKYGIKTYLADDTPSISGMMARLDKTFPTNDCSICIEAPQMYEVDNQSNIEILTNTEVRKVKKVKNRRPCALLCRKASDRFNCRLYQRFIWDALTRPTAFFPIWTLQPTEALKVACLVAMPKSTKKAAASSSKMSAAPMVHFSTGNASHLIFPIPSKKVTKSNWADCS